MRMCTLVNTEEFVCDVFVLFFWLVGFFCGFLLLLLLCCFGLGDFF